EQLRRQLEYFRRELEVARQALSPPNRYSSPYSPPQNNVPHLVPGAPSAPSPPSAMAPADPPRPDEWQPLPAQSADDKLREQIQQLREQVKRLEQRGPQPERSVLQNEE